MSKKSTHSTDATSSSNPQLRAAAEAQLARVPPTETPTHSAEELLHELQVHQIELEMQNDELRRAQLVMEVSRDRYVDLYEFSPVGYLTLTHAGQIAEINLAGAMLLGGERAKFLQQRFDLFIAPEDRDRWHIMFVNAMKHAEKMGIELELRRGDGSRISAHLDCLRAAVAGAPAKMHMALTDISAMQLNKQLSAAQDDLREAALYSRSLIEASLDPLVTIDISGKIMDVNAATEVFTGVARDRLIGSDFADYFTEPEQARAGYRQVFEQGYITDYPLAIRHVSGRTADVLYNASIFRNAKMEVAGIFAAARDVTELKSKNALLREKEEYLRATTKTTRDAIIVLEGETDTITEWNPAAEAIFGYTKAEALGRALHEFLAPPRFREAARDALAHFGGSGEGEVVGTTRELVALHKDGTEFPIELSLSAMQLRGKWYATGIARDITERKESERQLLRALEFTQGVINAIPDILFEVDRDGTYLNVWAQTPEKLAAQKETLLGKTVFDVLAPDAAEVAMSSIREADEKGMSFGKVFRLDLPQGESWFELSVSKKPGSDVRGGHFIVLSRDISTRKRAEEAFIRVNRHNEMILEAAGEGIYGVDIDGRIIFINPAALGMLGYEKDELIGMDSHAVLHHSKPDGSPYRQEDCTVSQSLRGGLSIRGKDETLWRKDRSPIPVLYSCTPVREDEKITGAVIAFQDITEIKRYQAHLERKSNYDDLTGLPNRNLLIDRLGVAVTRCQREQNKLAVLVLNLDRFGEINDSLGREIGDGVLRETAVRLRQLVREMDTLARSAGDEFVLVGEVGNEEEAAHLARRILEILAQPFRIEGRELFMYAGVGISILPKDGIDSEILLNNAQVAMYRTKSSGGNRFLFYSAEMNTNTLERLNLENELHRAIEHDELRLFYQPQVSLRNGEIIGMEALVRWQHPLRGLVSPMEFIPLAEATGLIVPLGEWVLRTACTQNRAWLAAGLRTVAVAVNLSARQFEVQDMVILTAKILNETGLDPSYLELELTESAAMGNAEAFVGVTEKLKGLSVTLSIDDFGTGYSSLSYLKRFALDRLKIDQSFVRDIIHDPDSAAIAQTVITLAHSLGLSVIAEGVETEAQLNFLRSRGCDEMQGYYFSKPLPAAEFEQLLREGRKLAFPADTDLSRHTLLLVDDEPSVLSALSRQLRREGFHILTATSALEGLELMATHEVGVVMSDQRMPHMTGSEFLAKVRKLHPDAIRIILSGYSDLKSIAEVVNRGEIYKFLEKPWDETALLETLREAFRDYEIRRKVLDQKN